MDRLMSMRVFQRVVDEGGFAAAARALDLSPAVVTRLVADLESHLGIRLLHRSTRRVSLTDAGEVYLERLRQILQDVEDTHAAVSSRTQALAGVVRLSAPPMLATHVLAPLIAEFHKSYPHIRFSMDVAAVDALTLIEDYDITLLATHVEFDASVIARRIVTSESILVASPAYLQRRGVPQVPEDLSRHDCLRLRLPGQRGGSWRLTHAAENRHVDVPVTPLLCVNHTDTLVRAVLDGAGITSTPLDVTSYLESGALVRVLKPWVTGQLSIYAALPSRKFMPQRTRLFLDYLTEQTQQRVSRAIGFRNAH